MKETTRGTTPTTPAFKKLPVITEQSDVAFNAQNIVSAVNRGNRSGGEVLPGTYSSSATIAMPIRMDDGYLELLESAVSDEWGSYVTTGAITGDFEADDDSFTRASGSFLTDTITARLRLGDLVAIGGASANATTTAEALDASETEIDLTSAANFPTPATGSWEAVKIENEWITYTGKSSNTLTGCTRGAFGSTAATHSNGVAAVPVKRITAITATKLTFANHPCVDETSIAITFATRKKQLFGGTTRVFGTVQRQHPDTDTDIFSRATGAEVNTLELTHSAAQETNAQFEFVGMDYANGEVASSTYAEASSNSPMTGTATNTTLLLDGAALSTCVTNFQVSINNNRVPKNGLGARSACFVEEGNRDVNISLAGYRSDQTFLDLVRNGNAFSLEFVIRDQVQGHGFRYVFANCKVQQDPGGNDGNTKTDTPTILSEYSTDLGTNILIESLLNK